jgi:uncharacterized protein (DUF1800 family)
MSRLTFLLVRGLLATIAVLALLPLAAKAGPQAADGLTERQKAAHVLNRLGFGPRPGDVERVEKMGIDAYIRQQLHPETIEDAAAEKAVAPLDTLTMDSPHLMDEFFGDIRRFLQQQRSEGDAADLKMRYGVEVPKQRIKTKASKPAQLSLAELGKRDALRCMGELQQAKILRAALSERQLKEVLVDFWSNHFNIDIRKDQCRALKVADDREVIRPHVLGKFRDLLGASAHSPAMLHYLDNAENSVPRERSSVELWVIEMYVKYKLGVSGTGLVPTKEGPNENYGREILELHTLGVDGGYTQKDVEEVARCFSGWGVEGGKGAFEFRAGRHDNGAKTVLGVKIPAGGGIKDGEKLLDILARHPSTARHISRKLCQRFVADDPPAELVDRAAKVFAESDGDIRRVVETIVTSPEFFSPKAFRAKIKSPFEYAVSAVRASGAHFLPSPPPMDKARGTIEGAATLGYGNENLAKLKKKTLNWSVYEMGQPLLAFAAPTGYPELSSKWVSPGALIDRLNFAVALTEQNVSDVRFDPAELVKGVDIDQPKAVLDRLAEVLLPGSMTEATHRTILAKAFPQDAGGTVNVAKVTALILGSPEFQRR